MKIYFNLVVVFFLVIGCYNQKNNGFSIDGAEKKLKQVAYSKYKNDTVFVYSPMKDYVLCKKKSNNIAINPNTLLHFFVYEFKTGRIVYEDKISGAKVSWKSDFELKIKKQRGIITSPEDRGEDIYIYDLKEGTKKLDPTQGK